MARLATVVIHLLTIVSIQRTLADLQVCNGKNIFILDINTFSEEADFPTCKLNEAVVIHPANGIPFLPNTTFVKSGEEGPFHLAAHGGPWHLYEAIRASTYNTEDPDEADFVYVYDHCLYMQWLAQVHTNGRVQPEGSPSYAGDLLIRAYNAMLKSSRWQRNNGSDFIFYDPHPGFADGGAESQFREIMCNAARLSIHIVAETGQRNTCQDYWTLEKKLLVAPYVPGAVEQDKPLQGFQQPMVPLKQRENLLYWQGGCYPVEPAEGATIYTGKTFRYESALELGDVAPDVEVRCTDTTLGGRHLPFAEVIEDMRKSIFCLVLPGDSASARRTTEIFMSGCIPVFLGPPYGTMPFAKVVDYKSSSYVVNVTEYGNWMNTPMLSENPLDDRPGHVQWIWFWVPDANVKQLGDSVLHADKMKGIIPLLRSIPNKVLNDKLKSLDQERQRFAFQPSITAQPSAISVVLEHICSTQTGGTAAEAPGSTSAAESPNASQSAVLEAQNRKVRGGIREASGPRLHDQNNYMIVQSAVQAAAHRYAASRTGKNLNTGLYKSAAAASVANEATRAAREMGGDW